MNPERDTKSALRGDATEVRGSWDARAILHVDLDAFFAAVEQLDHPEWRGRAVIVGGSPTGRGVVSTASYEARKFGIRSAMSAAQAARLAPPDAVWATPRFERYKELSDAMFAIFRDFSPYVQPISVDEAFIDISPGPTTPVDPVSIAQQISAQIDELGITCSIGVATGKTVAKIASDFDKPHGITVVPPGTERAFLAPLAIELMSGIGPKTAGRLRRHGIATLGDLAALDDRTATQLLGAHGVVTVQRCRGIDTRSVHDNAPVKSVSNERTFATDLREPAQVHSVIESLADRVGRRMRRKQLSGRTIHVKLRFSDFTTRTVQRTLSAPTDNEAVIGPIAEELIRSVWSPGVGVRLIGVGVTGLDEQAQQLDLFAEAEPVAGASPKLDEDRMRRLAQGLDAVRERFGDEAVVRGSRKLTPRTTGTPSASIKPDDIITESES